METVRGVAAGDKILQVGVGSGVKCGVNVWTALRPVREVHLSWAHRLSEEARRKILAGARIRGGGARLAMQHVTLRLIFVLFMGLLMAGLQLYMRAAAAASAAAPAACGGALEDAAAAEAAACPAALW